MMNKEYLIKNGVDLDKSLELFGDMDTYNDTLSDFVLEIKNKKENLKSSKEISDMQNYAIYAHSIKSDAKYFGFTHLAELALDHEMHAKSNNMYYITNHYQEFLYEIDRCEDVARSYLGYQKVNNHETLVSNSDFKMLIVDDSLVIKDYISSIFKSTYNIIYAKDGNEAINIIENNNDIKIMILDLNMPNANGFIVLDYLKEKDLFNKIPITVITGIGAKDVIEKTKNYPINNILLKPFNEAAIKDAVSNTTGIEVL